MKYLAPLCLLLLLASQAQADRLQLRFGSPLPKEALNCQQDPLVLGQKPPKLVLGESDVLTWSTETLQMVIDPKRFKASKADKEMINRCFGLYIDGVLLTTGPVVWSKDTRTVSQPVVVAQDAKEGLLLRVLNSNHAMARPYALGRMYSALSTRPMIAPPPIEQ